jgi:hypothetical protein
MIRRAPVVLVLVVAIMFQATTQICLGRQILSAGISGRRNDDETSTTQEVNHDEMQNILNSLLLVLQFPQWTL